MKHEADVRRRGRGVKRLRNRGNEMSGKLKWWLYEKLGKKGNKRETRPNKEMDAICITMYTHTIKSRK